MSGGRTRRAMIGGKTTVTMALALKEFPPLSSVLAPAMTDETEVVDGKEVIVAVHSDPWPKATEGDRLRFLRKAADNGLSPTDLGREFRTANAEFRVVGWHKSSKGAPVLAEATSGGILHRFPASQVASAIEAGRERAKLAAGSYETPDGGV